MKYNKSTVIVVILIVLCTVSVDVTWKYFLEKSARRQAVLALNSVKHCTNDLLLMHNDEHIVDYRSISDSDVEKALKICGGKSLITTTGDMFAFDLRTNDFVFDPSIDCYVEGGKKLTADSECVLHKDPKQCERILHRLKSGYDSDTNMKNWWRFDDAREYLEWVVLPNEERGYDGLTRGTPLIPHQIVLAQGVQEDELRARYDGFRVVLYAVGFISILINLLLAVHDNLMSMKGR